MIAPLASLLYATNLTYNSANTLFGSMDAQTSLAASVGPASDVVALHQVDQALRLQGIQAQTNYLVGQAMQTSAQQMLKQHEEMRERLMKAGATLV